jgi:hypothetical protein
VTVPQFSGDTTYPRVREFLTRYRFDGWSRALEADLGVKPLGAENARRLALTAGYIRDQESRPPDVSSLNVPALQVCAEPSMTTEYPWLDAGTRAYNAAQAYVARTLRPFDRRLCQRFATSVPRGRTVDVAGSHYVFFTRPALTARIIRSFVLTKPTP